MTAPAKRKLRSDAHDNRERILVAARAAFAREGFDVPVREIARRAQVGPATVYRHFPAKEELFAAAFAEQMARCSALVEEGLAAADPWQGFRLVIERLMELRALDQGFRTFLAHLPRAFDLTAHREHTLRLMVELMRRAKESGTLRPDVVLEDVVLAVLANEGIRAGTPEAGAAASRRFAALMLRSFRTGGAPDPLPPAVRLPPPAY
ncbi:MULTISPECIES: TetR/AcrR family transcriptional regulator [Streptomyces]|uniref:TetR family transcriptional regulator n=3 Tax=Streptomyces cacaoi TaxID=1898 RepID=A0A4Y3R8G9_STRCI|nr:MULTISPECIES: TetR/AcrR family transcriptional regulator [Streptomyces]NNG87934.1 TetR/AcrR family transcriptional regulator [Streptomyces cacaoi]QHF96121.1 TetR/AcrR family transcriptional regulator [Streptomyces sp. NHF165]GEB54036.1 TetR family transcriptional regulator [Streptomyces cacaoi]